MAVATLIIYVVVLRSDKLGKAAAWAGMLSGVAAIAEHPCFILASALAEPLLVAAGLLWVVWLLMIGLELLSMASRWRCPTHRPPYCAGADSVRRVVGRA